MKKLSQALAWVASAALVMPLLVAPLQGRAATTPTITANETVANVTTGSTDTQTNATTSATANVAEVKATRTVTVGSVPADAVTLTIGLCVVTFDAAATPDSNCSNNNAAINTTTNSTASLVAAALRALTSVSDTGHGALTVGGSGTTASFTTTGTETTAAVITASLSAGSAITLTTVNTTGVIPVAQVWRVTPANVEIGDVFTTIINGTTVSFTATAATVANVTAGLTAAINASAAASAVTASDQTTRVDVTSDTAGTAFTITSSATNRPAVAQVVTFTPANIGNANFNIILDGVSYSVRSSASASIQELVEALTAVLSGNVSATCTEDDTKVSCTAVSAGTAFTYDSNVSGYRAPNSGGGSHGGGSGGGSSNRTYTAPSLTAKPVVSTPATPAASAAFARDLEVGASGVDVKALQMYLNAHGYVVATTGVGSKGNETTLFGALTRAALVKLQIAAGITPAAGYFGPKTRAYISMHP